MLSLLTSPATMDNLRAAAAAYLASFLARARFIPHTVILHALHQLAGWCLAYTAARPAQLTLGPGSLSAERGAGGRLRASAEAAGHDLVMRHQVCVLADHRISLDCLQIMTGGLLSPSSDTGFWKTGWPHTSHECECMASWGSSAPSNDQAFWACTGILCSLPGPLLYIVLPAG